jgi:hypothetical protein
VQSFRPPRRREPLHHTEPCRAAMVRTVPSHVRPSHGWSTSSYCEHHMLGSHHSDLGSRDVGAIMVGKEGRPEKRQLADGLLF